MVGRQRGGDQGRAALSRERRHPGQVDPDQAQRPARGLRDRAGGQARVVGAPDASSARALVRLALGDRRLRAPRERAGRLALGGLPASLTVFLGIAGGAHRAARRLAPRVGGPAPRDRAPPCSAWWPGSPTTASGGWRSSRSSTSPAASGSRSPAAGAGCATSEFKSDQLASQLDRRISELFSLQELSYVLSESIQLDRIVDQVAQVRGAVPPDRRRHRGAGRRRAGRAAAGGRRPPARSSRCSGGSPRRTTPAWCGSPSAGSGSRWPRAWRRRR